MKFIESWVIWECTPEVSKDLPVDPVIQKDRYSISWFLVLESLQVSSHTFRIDIFLIEIISKSVNISSLSKQSAEYLHHEPNNLKMMDHLVL